MVVIAPPQTLAFRTGTRALNTPPVTIGVATDLIRVQLRRPTTALPLAWDATSTLRVTLVLRLDGIEYPCVSEVTGGVRSNGRGGEASFYGLQYRITRQMPTDLTTGRIEIGDAGYVRSRRLAQQSTEIQAFLRLQQISGANIDTELLLVDTVEASAPYRIIHRSVAYDADTAIAEEAGDGVVAVSHTPAGSLNLAAFAYGGNGQTSPQGTSIITYDTQDMGVAMWDVTHNGLWQHHGFKKIGIPVGAKTVEHQLLNPPNDQIFGVITMTGVDQTTPVGTAVTASGSGAASTPSATVASVGVDDLVVAGLLEIDNDFESPIGTVGADQTEQWRVNTATNGQYGAGATQLGSAGGVMTWGAISPVGANHFWGMGAVAFKPSTGGVVVPGIYRHIVPTQRMD